MRGLFLGHSSTQPNPTSDSASSTSTGLPTLPGSITCTSGPPSLPCDSAVLAPASTTTTTVLALFALSLHTIGSTAEGDFPFRISFNVLTVSDCWGGGKIWPRDRSVLKGGLLRACFVATQLRTASSQAACAFGVGSCRYERSSWMVLSATSKSARIACLADPGDSKGRQGGEELSNNPVRRARLPSLESITQSRWQNLMGR
mmetsp:Transcript_89343/g.207964  ORF Transcript_89343/g.207964 Transcript_89343/m.207964 type:complete len:202 (+) Transcript_89343:1631-2236(+)